MEVHLVGALGITLTLHADNSESAGARSTALLQLLLFYLLSLTRPFLDLVLYIVDFEGDRAFDVRRGILGVIEVVFAPR